MPKRKRLFAKLLAVCVVAAAPVAALDVAAAAASGNNHAAPVTAVGVASSRPTPPPSPAPGAETEAAGNLSVVVPQVPPHNALLGLCVAFLASGDNAKSDHSTAFQILIGATGGTVTSTTNWCQNYIRYRHDHPEAG